VQGTGISCTGQGQTASPAAGLVELAQRKTVTAARDFPPRLSAVNAEVHLGLGLDMLAHKENLDVEGKSTITDSQY
jgi:hypothetical protein